MAIFGSIRRLSIVLLHPFLAPLCSFSIKLYCSKWLSIGTSRQEVNHLYNVFKQVIGFWLSPVKLPGLGIDGLQLTSRPPCWCTEQCSKMPFGNLTLFLCKTCGAIFYCFVHQNGRPVTWMKTKNQCWFSFRKPQLKVLHASRDGLECLNDVIVIFHQKLTILSGLGALQFFFLLISFLIVSSCT